MQPHFTDDDRKTIEENALYLFANCLPRDQHNLSRLKQMNTPSNPVAKIKAQTFKKDGTRVKNNHHYEEDTPPCCINCVGATVHLTGRNVKPPWGLFNGSIGTVHDIQYPTNGNPNHDELPLYVAVEFKQYQGPVWFESNPKLVPVPVLENWCKWNCCTRKFMPLQLAFAKTCHTFQGQNVGPVQKGQPPNSFEKIIADPGTKAFEGTNPGLFYSIASRGTTLGEEQDLMSSSVYFTGKNMNNDRITNLAINAKGRTYKKVERRQEWVDYLNKHNHDSNMSDKEKEDIFQWASTAKYSLQQLQQIIDSIN